MKILHDFGKTQWLKSFRHCSQCLEKLFSCGGTFMDWIFEESPFPLWGILPWHSNTNSNILKCRRTHRLSDVVGQHPSQVSASEESDLEDSDSEAIDGSDDGHESAASEGNIDDFEPDTDSQPSTGKKISRRRSHGDSMRGPSISKRASGQIEPTPPELAPRSHDQDKKYSPVSNKSLHPESSPSQSRVGFSEQNKSPLESSRPSSAKLERPLFSRHASTSKFSSKPVPETRVATEEGPGPSIMFSDTPSPTPRPNRLPSAYRPSTSIPDQIFEAPEQEQEQEHPTTSRRGSSYSTQSIPLTFNDLPSRAQHMILNELWRRETSETAVMFTTLPSPVRGTSQSHEASLAYLGDLEVLSKDCPPVLFIHSNSMTVTMSLWAVRLYIERQKWSRIGPKGLGYI